MRLVLYTPRVCCGDHAFNLKSSLVFRSEASGTQKSTMFGRFTPLDRSQGSIGSSNAAKSYTNSSFDLFHGKLPVVAKHPAGDNTSTIHYLHGVSQSSSLAFTRRTRFPQYSTTQLFNHSINHSCIQLLNHANTWK